ncbi:hypothetical protein SAMN04488513_10228 [Pseudozobellia thermophila]|uniref:Uncharacterized protein n=2 Tax=Pseudozobellia thermophila TaxID=192903 RepID=A0A1M6EDX1_9FLAO|nr:hypothetical protein SAMN04488513_10228 [Pseudozobellia thermophila]
MRANENTHLKMKDIRMKTLRKNFSVYPICSILTGLMVLACTSTKQNRQISTSPAPGQGKPQEHGSPGTDAVQDYGYHIHEYISLKTPPTPTEPDSLDQKDNPMEKEEDASWEAFLAKSSPVAQKIVENYLNSENKEPGGHCLTVSKGRFTQAYKEVHGHLPYQDLPDSMATKLYTPKQVFNLLYATASDESEGWKSLPKAYRGKGNAGALAYAGMGSLVDSTGVWSGQLRPGAMLQVWRYREDYEQVVQGTDVEKLDPYGHSFIFINYVRDEKNKIVGLRIADQGFQSYRPLIPRDYEVWWAVNLRV